MYIAWSPANRSPLIRIPAARGKSTRVELRCPDPTCNPYLSFAIILAAGLDGIEKRMTPPPSSEQNIFQLTAEERAKNGIESMPGSLADALELMKRDPLVKSVLGEHVFSRFVDAKEKEWDDFRTKVTPWELDSYLTKY